MHTPKFPIKTIKIIAIPLLLAGLAAAGAAPAASAGAVRTTPAASAAAASTAPAASPAGAGGLSGIFAPGQRFTSQGLYGVAAQSATKAWAVGNTTAGHAVFKYGPPWVAEPHVPAFPAGTKSYLQGVAAIPPANSLALAAGYTVKGGTATGLIGIGNTAHWSTLYSGPADSYLFGVAATSPTNAWAVGYTVSGTSATPLILHGTGPGLSTWTPVTGLPVHGTDSYLYGVAATAAGDVYAVGDTQATPSAPDRTLIYHSSGGPWTRMPSPPGPNPSNNSVLFGVAATTASYPVKVWAVGGSDTNGNTQALILGLSGGTWHQVPAGDITFLNSPFDSAILGVSFVPDPTGAANPYVWAVGGAGIASDTYETVILQHYVSAPTWNQVTSPNPGPSNFLQGVSAFSPTSAWAVGAAGSNFLVERWSPSSPPWT